MQHISDFEQVASDLAIENDYKYMIYGHIHQPQMVRKVNCHETCLYLNSGDWVENLTSLEYNKQRWKLRAFKREDYPLEEPVYDNSEASIQNMLVAITITPKNGSQK